MESTQPSTEQTGSGRSSGWFPRLGTGLKVLLGIIVLLVILRALLPWVIKTSLNKTLNSIPGYYGHVEDVDVAIYRGAYRIQDLLLMKTHGNEKEPFVAIHDIDIALDWHALFQGHLKTRIILTQPQLQFINRESKEASQTSIDGSWQEKVVKLYPFDINRFIIKDGLVRYKDQTKDPKINLYLDQMEVDAENISNAAKVEARLPSTIDFTGRLLKSGKMKMNAKVNLLTDPMEADINASMQGLALKELNEFTKAYGNFDFEKGEFELAMELAASKTRYVGYVKTIAKKVEVLDWKKERAEGDSVPHLLWEGLVGGITTIFKNQKQDQFAARIPIESSRKELKIDTWSTLGSILRNAFVQALSPKVEQSVQFADALGKKKDEKAKDGTAKGAAAITH